MDSQHCFLVLQNDHRELMEKIKHAIENVHRTQKVNVPSSSHQSCNDEVEEFDEVPHPFAVVDSVSAFSPAEAAGLKYVPSLYYHLIYHFYLFCFVYLFIYCNAIRAGDRLIQIGSLTRRTFVSLYDVADVLTKAKGRPLTVIVNRDANDKRVVKMELTPRTWNGNGLIGAHISALSQ